MTTRPTPFLIDKATFSLLVVPDSSPTRLQLNCLRFCPDRTVVATNGHYLAAVKPEWTPSWEDFPAHGALDGATYAGAFEPFSLDLDGLKSVARVLKPCKKLPVLSYALVIPPIEGERTCRILVALNGDPANVATFNVPVSETRYPDFAKVVSKPEEYLKGKIGNTRLDARYLTEIMGIAKACDSGREQTGVSLSFTKVGGQVMFHGTRFVAVLMPMRTGNESEKDDKDAAEEARVLRSGFSRQEAQPVTKETEVKAKGSVDVGGISIPAIPGTTINGVHYGAPVVPLPEGAEVASLGR